MNKNIKLIQNLRDCAELAQASYFYFDLLKDSNGNPRKIYELDSGSKEIKDEKYPRGYKEIQVNLEHIVSKKYQGQEVLVNLEQGNDIFTTMTNKATDFFNSDKLNGEFGEMQVKHFFERYDLICHIPDSHSGFSATIFYDKLNANYIIAFRGTNDYKDVFADMQLAISGIAISQVVNLQNLIVNMLGHIYAHYSSQSNIDSHNISSNSSNANKQNLTVLKEYFLQHNIQIILTGHSLGGHLAQVCCVAYPLAIKELYTYNSPGLGGIIESALVIFLRVIRIIWKFLCYLFNSIAKLFNLNGFTRKTIDANLAKSGCKENTDDIIRVMEVNKDKEIFGELGINAKKAQRGENLGIEIHHIESVSVNIQDDDSFAYSLQQLIEPTISIITDLGIRLGLNINDKLDYKNTEVLHLINLGYSNHSILSLTQHLYFYAYLLGLDFNANRYANINIANTLDNLNEFMQWIKNSLRKAIKQTKKVNIKRNKVLKSNTKKAKTIYPLDYLLGEISYIAYNKDDKGIQKFDKDKQIDIITQLQESKIYTKILDRDCFDDLTNKQCNVADIRAFMKCQPFIVIDENNQEILQENNMTTLFLYKDFTNITNQILNSYKQSEIV